MTAWITDTSGWEEKTRILDVSPDSVTVAIGQSIRRLRAAEIAQVSVPHFDNVINGALIGTGAAIVSGLAFCRLMEPWDVCLDAGSLFKIGAMGAGIGIAVDSLIRGRKTVFEGPKGSARLHVIPLIDCRAAGLQISFDF